MPLLVTFLVWCPDGYLQLDARLAAWPHCHVQASSVWWAVPHPAPAFLPALPATLTPASSSYPSCHWDHLQISVLVFCLPERRGYNYPPLPCCLGVWWRYMLRHTRSNQTFLLRLKAMGLGTARRNQEKSSAGMTLILWRKWSGKKICHLKPDWEQPCRNLTGLKWCQLVSDLTHLHFTEHWQTPEAASSREVPASLWGAEHPKPASEAKKVNKSVIQQLVSCISIAKERETPFVQKADLSLLKPWFLNHIFHSMSVHQLQVSLSRPHGQGLREAQLPPPRDLLLSVVTHRREGGRLCRSSSPATSESFGLALPPGRLRVPMSDALLTGSAN